MRRLLVAISLLAACRGGCEKKRLQRDAGRVGSAFRVSALPKLPLSEDGVAAMHALDKGIEIHRDKPSRLIPLLLERATIRGRLEDYEQLLAASAAFVAQAPRDAQAWQFRVQALLRVHDVSAARAALEQLRPLIHASHLVEYEVAFAEAGADRDKVLAGREALAKEHATPARLTLWAVSLAQAGRFDEAIAIIPQAAAVVRDNPPSLLAWLLFQWGRLYEQHGELATAREFYAAAHARYPAYVEATAHLAQTMAATGDASDARALVHAALVENRHPELLAIAASLGRVELAAEAQREWERYAAALPLAFSDHAARVYLTLGRDPLRALKLARFNARHRDNHDARALLVEAALAANDATTACSAVEPLAAAGIRAHRFLAWKALSQCGRRADADRLAAELGIAH